MKYIAAYALLVLGGKAEPSAADLEKVLKEAGIKSEAEHVTKITTALKGKNFNELIASGKKKMTVAAPSGAPAGGKAPAADKKAKEEEKPKEEEAADVDMGNMFGDEY
jgi:large subunit ribosomal protein LP2